MECGKGSWDEAPVDANQFWAIRLPEIRTRATVVQQKSGRPVRANQRCAGQPSGSA